MTALQSKTPWQFSLAQLCIGVTIIALNCGALVADLPLVFKTPLVFAALALTSGAAWFVGYRMGSAQSMWVQGVGEIVKAFGVGFCLLFIVYWCVAVGFLIAYLLS